MAHEELVLGGETEEGIVFEYKCKSLAEKSW